VTDKEVPEGRDDDGWSTRVIATQT
jgi:hypothetical protein